MFWELYQQGQISKAQSSANSARHFAEASASRNSESIAAIDAKIDSLALTCLALFEILEAKHGVTEDELTSKMEEIDLRDGTKDGRITASSKVCSSCGRRVSPSRTVCMYCGGLCVPE